MTENDLRSWLTLLRANVARPKLRAALEACGTAAAIIDAPGRLRARLNFSDAAWQWLEAPDAAQLDADCEWLARDDCHLVVSGDPLYPPLLDEIADPPLALFVRGDPALLAEPQLAMVGSRNPTPSGRETAADFAAWFARAGLIVTSGLALGIDGASHRGALDGGGATIAVCGTGLDRIYPARHGDLGREIAARGALVSEYPLGTRPLRHNFPERNRIISGLSLGTLVVEAAQQSGSLITARLATGQGREVFAIPGSIHNPLAHGCHRLIRDGAKLVETAGDVLEELAPLLDLSAEPPVAQAAAAPDAGAPPARAKNAPASRSTPGAAKKPVAAAPAIDAAQRKLLNCVDFAPTSVDCVVARSGLTAAQVSSMLLALELQDMVTSAPGGGYMRTAASGEPPKEI